MRGIHSVVDDLRRQVFTEVARLAYEGGDFSRIDALPYKIIPGEDAQYRHDVFLERAIVTERLRLACGLPLRTAAEMSLASDGIEEAAKPEKYYEPAPHQHHPLRLQRLPAEGDPRLFQLPGLPLPPLHERLPQGRHLRRPRRQERH